jgi:anti-sigma regulatory factor (Ser/Thr protein kinase)
VKTAPKQRGEVRLALPATVESLRRVRHAVEGFAEALDASPTAIGNVKIAVTEACSNVVVHAYPGHVGMVEVEAKYEDHNLVVWVRDYGRGITQPSARPGLGIGLGLMASVSDVFEAYPGFLRGTTVVMRFELDERQPPPTAGPSLHEDDDPET